MPGYWSWYPLLLPFSGYATMQVLQRYASSRDIFIAALRFARFRKEVSELRRQRHMLERTVIKTIDQFRPTDIEPLFLEAGLARIGQGNDQ